MNTKEKSKQQLLTKIRLLEKKILRCETLEFRLKLKDKKLKALISTLEEKVETRTAAERIINKQLHSEIEQRKLLEAELNNKRQLLETILNGITEQIMLISKDFRILWANKTFLDQFNCKIGDLSGKYCYQVTHNQNIPCQPPHDICPIAHVLKSGFPTTEIHTHQGPKGKFFSEVSAYPIKNEKGEVVEFVHIARDVTEQNK